MLADATEDAPLLFDVPPDWRQLWIGMPEFEQKDLTPWQTISVHFRNLQDRKDFAKLIEQTLTDDTQSVWHPKSQKNDFSNTRWISKEPTNPRYPVYVISKGRFESRLTGKSLEKMRVPYRMVVEPQERDAYAAVMNPSKILTLPFSNLGQGSIPARNWVWEHALSEGAERHWILDDNIDGFVRLHNNQKIPVATGAIFKAAEDFSDRYENVGISGFNYRFFADARDGRKPPLTMNTRVYSCILIKNDIPYRWRGRYNEDTDLSIRALKDGWCTVLFNAFLANKQATMTMKGGNTEELYQGDGRLEMAKSLQDQHPDCVKITRKWDRWQHHVDYDKFCNNKMILKSGVQIKQETDNFGMELEVNGQTKNGLGLVF